MSEEFVEAIPTQQLAGIGGDLVMSEYLLICEHGQPYGIRDRSGYLFFFAKVNKYDGQEERYRNEVTQRAQLASFLLQSLQNNFNQGRG